MGTSMMKAITYSEFGISTDVLKLKELPIPKAGNGEVQVSLQFSGSNPSDAKSRAGNRPGVTKPQFEQIVPNSDGSGVITVSDNPRAIGVWNYLLKLWFSNSLSLIHISEPTRPY